MEQATDFWEETQTLYKLLQDLSEGDYERETLFKKWTINDILVHLHFWNQSADLSLNNSDEFDAMMANFFDAIKTGKLRPHENAVIPERGKALLELWVNLSEKLVKDFSTIDPKQRLKWAGPTMSARTCISARQMEVWAHGQAIYDLLGKDRVESDRIKNIVILGLNAFGWSHQVHGLPVPKKMPRVILKSPSGEEWSFGDEEAKDSIKGNATQFAQVVTQTRNILDTGLQVSGETAQTWMANAQCFAGPPETPPSPGLRKKA